MGPPVDSVQLPKKSGFMVDITIVFMGVIMVYKPTYNWGAHPVTPVFRVGYVGLIHLYVAYNPLTIPGMSHQIAGVDIFAAVGW